MQPRFICAALVAAVSLYACGGGGSSSTTPVTTGQAPKAVGTLPPSSAKRVPVATGSLKLVMPQVLKVKNAPVVASRGKKRAPKYVNPVSGNVLDLWVDGTLLENVDGQVGTGHSMYLVTASDGTASVQVPLYSSGVNLVVAVEWDPNGTQILAIGETNVNITPGTVNALSMTMLMNAQGVAIVDYPGLTDPELMNEQSYTGGGTFVCPSSPSANGFRLFPTDYEGVLVPTAGYGGTLPATISNASSDGGGSTHLAQSPTGTNFVAFDGNCNSLSLTATAANPANAVWNDIINNNDLYSTTYPSNGSSPGAYQGIWNLVFVYASWPLTPAITQQHQLSGSSAGGFIDIQGPAPASPTPSPAPSGSNAASLQVSTTDVEIIGLTSSYSFGLDVFESTYLGQFTEDDGGSCSGIATFSAPSGPGQDWTLTITGVGAGTCTVTIGDQNNQTVNVNVTVTTSGLGFQSVRRKGH